MEATHEVVQQPPPAAATSTHSKGMLLQKKCACGGSPGLSGLCDECQGKRLTVQRYSRDRTTLSWFEGTGDSLSASLTRGNWPTANNLLSVNSTVAGAAASSGVRTTFISRQSTQLDEPPEADHAEAEVANSPSSSSVDRGSSDSSDEPVDSKPERGQRESTATTDLIVEDDTRDLQPGQMRKSEFLDLLRTRVCTVADAELARVGRDSRDCPYIERAFAHYREFTITRLERVIRRYVGPATATSAGDYVDAITARIRTSVAVWTTTGQITGVPAELSSELPAMGLTSVLGALSSGIGGAFSGLLGNLGTALEGIGRLLPKARETGAAQPDLDPAQIKSELRDGQSLNGGIKNQMESAFGHDFSRVRVHTNEQAAKLASLANARAFTIGNDIAFGANEYQPGTLTGDALIAHELAHVVQQGVGGTNPTALGKGTGTSEALEEDADISAVGAVVSIWGAAKGAMKNISRESMPRLRSGLRMQRCPASTPAPRTATTAPQTAPSTPTVQPACPPALQNPRWDVSDKARVFPSQGKCAFRLIAGIRASGSAFGPDGMEFNATIRPTPACKGSVYFVQYVKVNRARVGCLDGKPRGDSSTTPWGIDTNWPYPSGTNSPTDGDRLIKTVDSPGMGSISDPFSGWVRFCLNDEFVTYIVYDDGKKNITPLGWMHWIVNAQALRDKGTCPPTNKTNDCTGWNPTGGGKKLGESFVAGNKGPVPLDPSAKKITAATFDNVDCKDAGCDPVCPAPSQ